LITFQANRFCPFTSALPEDYERRITKLPGVTQVVPIQVWTNNCRASLDIVVFHGVQPEKLRSARQLRLISGSWDDFARSRDSALMGATVARRRDVSAGQSFSIGGVTVRVAGIYEADSPSEEDFIYTHLEFLQRRQGQNTVGTVTQFEIQLADGVDAEHVAQQVDDLFRGGPVATDTRPKGVFQASSIDDLMELIHLAGWLGMACVALVLALVSTTTVMAVQDRIREHAVLQTLGYSGAKIYSFVLCESVLQSAIGGVIGIGAALSMLAYFGLTVGAEGVSVAFTPTLSLALPAIAVALAAGVIAGLVPAWKAARADIVPALRQV
jgi:putative ABC transport system permease protein